MFKDELKKQILLLESQETIEKPKTQSRTPLKMKPMDDILRISPQARRLYNESRKDV